MWDTIKFSFKINETQGKKIKKTQFFETLIKDKALEQYVEGMNLFFLQNMFLFSIIGYFYSSPWYRIAIQMNLSLI